MVATSSDRWRLLDTPPASGAFNMALDRVLMNSVRSGGHPVLRFYRWSPPCLSLGRNQPAADHYDESTLRLLGIDVVRRPTGGRAVLHDRELTYSVVMQDRVMGSPRAAYSAINAAFISSLRTLGVDAQMQAATGERAAIPSLAPCFREPAEGEVVAGGSKLLGSAQMREGGVVLQHGSLLLADDQSRVSDLLVEGASERIHPPVTLSDLLNPLPTWITLVKALVAGWEREIGPTFEDSVRQEEHTNATELAVRLSDPEQVWQRAGLAGA